MDDRDIEEPKDWDPDISMDVIRNILKDPPPPPPLVGDITFEDTPRGFEVHYSDRIATEHQDLIDESADWLEDQLGVLNLGQIDRKILMADSIHTTTAHPRSCECSCLWRGGAGTLLKPR
jgi:hypothetical protein